MLIYYKDPKCLSGAECFELDYSLTLQENIEKFFPHGFNHEVTDIYINGEKIDPLTYDLHRQVSALDEIRIINRQQGVIFIGIAIAVVAAVATYMLAPKPKIPNQVGEQRESTNNRLTGQTNIARLYQAKPDVYGKVRVYPDIVKAAGSEYVNNVKYIDHLFCVGIGRYQLENFKYADTLLDRILGTTYKVYEPGDVMPLVRYQYASDEVDGQELTPPNLSKQVIRRDAFTTMNNITMEAGISTCVLSNPTKSDGRKAIDQSVLDYYLGLSSPIPVQFTIQCTVFSGVKTGKINPETGEEGVKNTQTKVTDVNYRGILTRAELLDDGSLLLGVSNTSFVSAVGKIQQDIISITPTNSSNLVIKQLDGVFTTPFTLPELGTEIQIDVIFPRGLHGYVELEFLYWQMDEQGNRIEGTQTRKTWSVNKQTYENLSYSIKISDLPRARYGIIGSRINNGKDDLTDQVKLENIFICDYAENVPVNDTLIYVKTRATTQATSLKELKFNVEATRKTITYDAETGQIVETLAPSRSFADAVLHTFVEIYGRDPDELDLVELYAIDKRLKALDPRLGYFDFSFDDIDVSLGQRIETICNAARVFTFRDGQKWRFSRVEEKTRPAAMFNSANSANTSEGGTIMKKASLPTSYDGVQVEYVDSSYDRAGGTDKKAFINLKIQDRKIVEGYAFRPYKIQLAGCRNHFQAMNRAQLEIRKLIYERTFVEDEVLADAGFVNRGDVVLWCDCWDRSVCNGEIVRIEDGRFYVDRQLDLDSDKSYRVAITDRGGYPSEWLQVKAFGDDWFSADYQKAYIADNINVQMGSIFIITETVSDEPTEYLLTDKTYSNGNYKIKLTNYDRRIFEYDRETLKSNQE